MDDFISLLFGIFIGFILCGILFKSSYGQDLFEDAETFSQLIQPCLDQGYTKSKCREMIYIPQSEVK